VLLVGEPVARFVASVILRRGAIAMQIESRAEAAAGTGQYHRATGALRGGRAQLAVQRLAQLAGHRVELLGAIEREPAYVGDRLID